MTNRELDAQIAEKVMGWALSPAIAGEVGCGAYWIGAGPCTTEDTFCPSTDLNECFRVQAICIERVGLLTYATAFEQILPLREFHGSSPMINSDEFLTATAEQRCRAMLRALEGASK